MPLIQVNLTDEQFKRAEEQAREARFASVEAYLASLVQERDYGAPEHLKIKSREHLAQLIQEGIDSGPGREWNEEYRAELLARGRKTIAAASAEKAAPNRAAAS